MSAVLVLVLVIAALVVVVVAVGGVLWMVLRKPPSPAGPSAAEEATLVRSGRLTHQQALERIAARHPHLSRAQAEDALAKGMFETR